MLRWLEQSSRMVTTGSWYQEAPSILFDLVSHLASLLPFSCLAQPNLYHSVRKPSTAKSSVICQSSCSPPTISTSEVCEGVMNTVFSFRGLRISGRELGGYDEIPDLERTGRLRLLGATAYHYQPARPGLAIQHREWNFYVYNRCGGTIGETLAGLEGIYCGGARKATFLHFTAPIELYERI